MHRVSACPHALLWEEESEERQLLVQLTWPVQPPDHPGQAQVQCQPFKLPGPERHLASLQGTGCMACTLLWHPLDTSPGLSRQALLNFADHMDNAVQQQQEQPRSSKCLQIVEMSIEYW